MSNNKHTAPNLNLISCNALRYSYVPVQESLSSDDLGTYVTYGLSARLSDTEVAFVSDISTDFDTVLRLAHLCTQNQLDPVHLLDVVEDFVAESDLITQ